MRKLSLLLLAGLWLGASPVTANAQEVGHAQGEVRKVDKDAKKVNLGVGAYRDNNGKPYVFPIVKKVEKEIVDDATLDKEYAPIEGVADFIKGSQMVTFGWDHPDITSGRIATC